MSNLYELAEFLVASWKLANPERKMPTSHGILDAALDRVKDSLPTSFCGIYTFSATPEVASAAMNCRKSSTVPKRTYSLASPIPPI